MKRLMVISYPATSCTGFGTVLKNILPRLNGIEKYVVSMSNMNRDPEVFNGWIQLTVKYAEGVKAWYNKIKPDIVMVYGSWPQVKLWHENKIKHSPLFHYIVVENEPIPKNYPNIAKSVDVIFTPSKFSKSILEEAGVKSVQVLPHGVDTTLYKPVGSKRQYPFVYGCVSDNNIRKQLLRLLEAFRILDDRDAILYLVTEPRGKEKQKAAEDLVSKVERWNIKDRVRWPREAGYIGIPTWELPMHYKKMNVHVLPSAGESFGLPCLEAAACGIPNIVSEYGGMKEYLQDAALYIKIKTFVYFLWGRLALIDIDDLVYKMKLIKIDNLLRKQLGKRSIEIAEDMTWDKPANTLNTVIREYI